MSAPTLFIVIPCYNEEEVLPITAPMFLKKLLSLVHEGKIADASRIMFVNDGSRDRTWEIISELSRSDEHYIGISQSRNRGHQNAVLAGLMEARGKCDITISVDCDGQDDINAMGKMVDAYADGCDVVYGVRSSRETDTFFKRSTAQGFYKFLSLMGAEVVYNHADYRLISARALDALSEFHEVNLFLRGIVPDIGFRSDVVYYDRSERAAGESKYPLKKMIAFAVDGITSFSVKPLTIISRTGIVIAFLSVLGLVYALVSKFCFHSAVSGWTAIIASIWLLGGIQLFCLGILGCYIGKIFSEVKHRPRYVTERFLKK